MLTNFLLKALDLPLVRRRKGRGQSAIVRRHTISGAVGAVKSDGEGNEVDSGQDDEGGFSWLSAGRRMRRRNGVREEGDDVSTV